MENKMVDKEFKMKRESKKKSINKEIFLHGKDIISHVSGVVTKGARDFCEEGKKVLENYHCYVKEDANTGGTYISFNDYDLVYGEVKPRYHMENRAHYMVMKDVLSLEGYSDPQILIILSGISPNYQAKYTFPEDNIPTVVDVMNTAIQGIGNREEIVRVGRGR